MLVNTTVLMFLRYSAFYTDRGIDILNDSMCKANILCIIMPRCHLEDTLITSLIHHKHGARVVNVLPRVITFSRSLISSKPDQDALSHLSPQSPCALADTFPYLSVSGPLQSVLSISTMALSLCSPRLCWLLLIYLLQIHDI